MKVTSTKHFEKHLKNCPADIQKRFVIVYDRMVKAKKLSEIQSLEKLSGYSTFYRVRIGNYRLGFDLIEGEQIELLAILHRKEIYRFFP